MDSAYDHIQEETFASDATTTEPTNTSSDSPSSPSLNTEFQEAYNAVANSPWGARLGGLWGSVKKAGEQYYEEAQKINTAATTTASQGWTDIVSRTRSLSLNQPTEPKQSSEISQLSQVAETIESHPDRPESLAVDIVKEAQSMVSRLRSEAAKRLKDIEKAEDAADEALLRFGNNIKSFLQDAVSIAPPTEIADSEDPSRILFESKDADGKRVIHTNRLDAQLHVIHSSLDSFLKDPAGPEFDAWSSEFDVDARTSHIATDLDKYPELRTAMENIVPERSDYATFWCRYYFLKRVAEMEEQRRKELLQGATAGTEEDVTWDSDQEDEANTPNAARSTTTLAKNENPGIAAASLKPADVLSQPDSDASYALVSRATSRAGGSPKEIKRVEEESDEDDWE